MPAHLIAEEGPLRGLILNLEEGDEWILGRDPEKATFVIEDDTVSRRAVRLTRDPEGIHLENLSRVNPTLVNDEQVEGSVLLKEGDRVQVGHTVFLFSEREAEKGVQKKNGGYEDIFGSLEESPPQESPEEDEPSKKRGKAPKKKSEAVSAYDTIFEDTGEGMEPMPFNILAESPLILKVISGPNAGAEIGIEKGKTYTLGKDPSSCDIVFQDLSVSRSHARLTVSEDGAIEIEDLGSKNGTVVNGTPITEKRSITTQDMVALGTTIFLIIDREAPQETIYSPMVPHYEQPLVEAAAPEVAAVTPAEEKRDWRKVPIPMKYLVGAASFAAIFLIIFLSFFSLFKSNQVEVVRKEPVSRIQKALAKFDGVQFSFNPASGKLFLVGHVLTAVEAQEMSFRIGEIDFITSTEDNVIIDEFVDKMMNDILSGNPEFRGITIQSPAAGKFVAVGYIDTNAAATLLAEYLTVNFPYLDRLENHVVVGENLNAQIQGLLQSKGFGSLTFQYANGEIVLAGNYSNKMDDQFKDLLKEIDQIKGVSGVKNFAVASSPTQAAIDISGQFQVTGNAKHDGKGYSVILNGKIYTVGTQVDGMGITEIDPTTILLEKDGIKYKINYSR
jgi:type III secretion system YscD/HrpQ family protein